MNLLSWNCQGVGNRDTVRVLGDLLKSINPAFVFLSETLVTSNTINELCSKFGFADCFTVDRVGRGGGLAVMWKNSITCWVVDSSTNHIDVHLIGKNSPAWRLSCFYGFPERTRQQESWDFLRYLAAKDNLPWSVFGDFNDLLYATDKKGFNPHPQALFDGFRAAVDDSNLSELDLTGGEFTWGKSKGKPNWV